MVQGIPLQASTSESYRSSSQRFHEELHLQPHWPTNYTLTHTQLGRFAKPRSRQTRSIHWSLNQSLQHHFRTPRVPESVPRSTNWIYFRTYHTHHNMSAMMIDWLTGCCVWCPFKNASRIPHFAFLGEGKTDCRLHVTVMEPHPNVHSQKYSETCSFTPTCSLSLLFCCVLVGLSVCTRNTKNVFHGCIVLFFCFIPFFSPHYSSTLCLFLFACSPAQGVGVWRSQLSTSLFEHLSIQTSNQPTLKTTLYLPRALVPTLAV